jgi:hypothetical protein
VCFCHVDVEYHGEGEVVELGVSEGLQRREFNRGVTFFWRSSGVVLSTVRQEMQRFFWTFLPFVILVLRGSGILLPVAR